MCCRKVIAERPRPLGTESGIIDLPSPSANGTDEINVGNKPEGRESRTDRFSAVVAQLDRAEDS